ncbi:MAG: excinuclease ABC subunit UvrA, partial [Muribaculaceae bacterium]|nr:excinuclease ABC subunit UvrA [Muribaculaceae bacterium]
MQKQNISIKGARVNNLKNVDVELPRNQLIVITGLSGSGKSSLAFDTLYAEGRRRYVESLSAYARQFLGKIQKPECDSIKGLPPAIAIEQKVTTRNPRSTVGTSTEIYDYLRMLFGRIGKTYSPVTGKLVKRHTEEDVLAVAASYPSGSRIAVSAPITLPDGRDFMKQIEIYRQEGYSRLITREGRFLSFQDLDSLSAAELDPKNLELLVDRLATAESGDEVSRLAESAETAFFEGHETCVLYVWNENGQIDRHEFSRLFEADGIVFNEPSEQMFNFNNPFGACPVCEGFGNTLGIDPRLVVPDTSLSVYSDAVMPWRSPSMSTYKKQFLKYAAEHDFPIHTPYSELSENQIDILWHGDGNGSPCIDDFFSWIDSQRHQIQYRALYARYRGRTVCPECHGSRLRKDASYVKIDGHTISELVRMPVKQLSGQLAMLELDAHDTIIAERLLKEIRNRLEFLEEVGLGYLTLDRLSNTLSGGESQRINLATSLGSSLVGSLYILDEPSIGLHPRDTERLIKVLRKLQRIGNTVVVVEHDEEIMRASDRLIDVGPDAGRLGGEIVYQGPVNGIADAERSHTMRYLSGKETIPVPESRRAPSGWIEVKGASEHNLKNIDVRFPLGVMTAVTGVSGSGKSTLVRDVLYRSLLRHLGEAGDAPGRHKSLGGDLSRLSRVEFVDQNPIGRSTRSNPATYLKAYDEIRNLFAEQQASRQMGFTPGYFSFNTEGGRCEECKGEGVITIEMQFMADITIPCESCHGQRFKPDVLEIRYRGLNIHDVLELTVAEAIEFFSQSDAPMEKRIVKRLQPLADVGLGYIKLGQSSATLSGGENQRVKLAFYLSQESPDPTLFIFDEPTTGLHFHDIRLLLDSFSRLLTKGHSIIVIEHNVDVIRCADHVIDIGPEGGDLGGFLVASGTPEDIRKCSESYTG